MAAPALAPILKRVAFTVITNKNLRKIVGGIALGIVIIIFAPIIFLLSILTSGQSIDWNSPEIQQQIA